VSLDPAPILEALAKIDGLNPTPATPATIVAGSAWPVWRRLQPVNVCHSQETWQVYVALPNGVHEVTTDAGRALVDDVLAVLWEIPAHPGEVVPDALIMEPGGQTIPVLRFEIEM
jgi:hypothetical protein